LSVAGRRWRRRYQANPDRTLLESEELAADKEYEFEFTLKFPDEASVRRAAARLRSESYRTEVEKLENIDRALPWNCSAKRWMYPSERALADIRRLMNAIAEESGGKYEDWIALSATETERPPV